MGRAPASRSKKWTVDVLGEGVATSIALRYQHWWELLGWDRLVEALGCAEAGAGCRTVVAAEPMMGAETLSSGCFEQGWIMVRQVGENQWHQASRARRAAAHEEVAVARTSTAF